MIQKKNRKNRWLIVVTLFVAIGSLSPLRPAPRVNVSRLEAYCENARIDWKIPGMAVAVVKDGRIFLSRGFGLRRHGQPEAVDDETLFAIASNTKAFTAAGLARLVAGGQIDWQDRVKDYLPYLELYDPYVTEQLNLRDLLCHRVGLKTFSGDLLWYETSYSTEEVIRRSRYLTPGYGFRDGYGYSNIMFMVAGEILAKVAKMPWSQYMQRHFFAPLNMKSTHVGVRNLDQYNNVATPHFVYPDGTVIAVPYTTSENFAAAGGINSNVRDMCQWLMMLLNNGIYADQIILDPAGIQEMWSVHNPLGVRQSSDSQPAATQFRGYGLGWGIFDYYGKKVLNHGGGLDGMISQVALVPELKLGMVILTNSINRLPSALMYRILDTFMKRPDKDWSRNYLQRYLKQFESEQEKIAKDHPLLEKPGYTPVNQSDFCGVYSCPLYGSAELEMTRDTLTLTLLPAPVFKAELFPLEHDIFIIKLKHFFSFMPHGVGKIQFFRDINARVSGFTIHIPNHDFHFDELHFSKKK